MAEDVPPASSPNVVVIVLDTLRADHLGCYGYTRDTSPRIDAWAKRSTLYRRAIATAPWTVPTHASLFTGLHPFEHGAHTYIADTNGAPDETVKPLGEHYTTLAEALRAGGYQTAAFVANAGYLSPAFQMDQGFDTYVVKQVWSPVLNQSISQWLEQTRDRPFFLFINYLDTHAAYNTAWRPAFLEKPLVRNKRRLFAEFRQRVLPAGEPVPRDLVEQMTDVYDTAVANVDDSVGALLNKLVALGLRDHTVVLLTSDHGEYRGEHHLTGHSKDVYEEALRVPLIVQTPGQRRGAIIDAPISSVDVPRLILSLLPDEVSGKHLSNFPYEIGNHPIVSENYYARPADLQNPQWGHRFDRVRTALYEWPFKYIRSSDERDELYNLEEDGAEANNLLARDPETARRLANQLEAFQSAKRRAGHGDPATTDPVILDDELRARLQSLGYAAEGED
ncbi:MAG: sulfatase [bacterium]|nr:sulfatase [bacterium]